MGGASPIKCLLEDWMVVGWTDNGFGAKRLGWICGQAVGAAAVVAAVKGNFWLKKLVGEKPGLTCGVVWGESSFLLSFPN